MYDSDNTHNLWICQHCAYQEPYGDMTNLGPECPQCHKVEWELYFRTEGQFIPVKEKPYVSV